MELSDKMYTGSNALRCTLENESTQSRVVAAEPLVVDSGAMYFLLGPSFQENTKPPYLLQLEQPRK
jgi:hypothetical protein